MESESQDLESYRMGNKTSSIFVQDIRASLNNKNRSYSKTPNQLNTQPRKNMIESEFMDNKIFRIEQVKNWDLKIKNYQMDR